MPDPRQATRRVGLEGGRNTSPWTSFHPVSSRASSLHGSWCENVCDGGYVDMHVVGKANQLLIPVVPSNVSPQSAHNDKSQDP